MGSKTPFLKEGRYIKGGVNTEPSQVLVRPPAPKPMHRHRPEPSQIAATARTEGGGVIALFDLVAHLHRQRDFSLKTFGPGLRTEGVVDHIKKELKEIQADPTDHREWIDVIILGFDGLLRTGIDPAEAVSEIVAKQTKNEGRDWPDWRNADPNKAIEHNRSKDPKAGEAVDG